MFPCLLLGAALSMGPPPATGAPAASLGADALEECVVLMPEEGFPLPSAPTPGPSGIILTAGQEAYPVSGPGQGSDVPPPALGGPITLAVPSLSALPAEAVGAKPARGGGAPPEKGPEPPRRALPSPFDSPPFPGSEYQGYPLIGVPPDFTMWPLMKALQGTPAADVLLTNKIRAYGWVTAEGNWSTSKHSNTPDSYWIRPNKFDLDQALIRFERNLDSVQTDHIDWGFRSTLD